MSAIKLLAVSLYLRHAHQHHRHNLYTVIFLKPNELFILITMYGWLFTYVLQCRKSYVLDYRNRDVGIFIEIYGR